MKHVDIVVPVHNEEENVGLLAAEIGMVFKSLPYNYSVLFVDDGSTDKTLEVLRVLCERNPNVKYLAFSRNFGHQNALKAGLDHSYGDCAISLDGDMQHPPEVIPRMLEKWQEGFDVVYTLRMDLKTETSFLKRKTSSMFYNILNRMADIDMEKGSADFRLLSKPAVDVIKGLTEYDLFFRGLVKWIGFNQVSIEYTPAERKAGVSKYTFKKMVRFALQGITSFSTRPLYAAAYLGFVFSLLSLLYIPYALISYYFGHTLSGWASIIVTIAFFGGLQLTILGIIGLYLGKLFMQSKQRPLYIIKERSNEQ